MGRQPGWMVTQTGRPAMRSPIRRDLERAVWRRIAEGMTSEDAAGAVGVSGPVGSRWFRERGGMAMFLITPVTGRNLSFDEREVMALHTAQGAGGAGERPAAGPSPLDGVTRTAPQRRYPRREAGVSGLGRAVEGRADGAPSEDRQAGCDAVPGP